MSKVLSIYSAWGGESEVKVQINRYAHGNNLAIQLFEHDDEFDFWEPYATLTVNFPDEKLAEDEAYVDDNNIPFANEFIEENNLGVAIPGIKCSGFCIYQKYRFFLDELKKYELKDGFC